MTTRRQNTNDERRMFMAMWLTGGFMIAEVIGGLLSGSLALLADAGHMLTDTASLALAWLAARAGRRPADQLRSYGYQRLQIIAAFVNGITFIVIVVWILIEAVQRLMQPIEVLGGMMLVVAVLGLMVNIAAFAILHGGNRANLNLRGALIHVIGDLLGSVAAISAALIILWTGWMPIDPLLSVLVALLILRSAWHVVRHSTHILLEGAPEDVDVQTLREALTDSIPVVHDVHHVHVWSLTPEHPLLTLHLVVAPGADYDAVLRQAKGLLVQRFGIDHTTIQIEQEQCADEQTANSKAC
ncbi:MAG: cation diffusion facilitator family transporter [Pseudomonadota bacterium]|nr:MAG: cation diffusion facilitator family transporter [Pseudomonadota bacterium]